MITGTYPYLSDLARNHICAEHPEEPLVVVQRPEGLYTLACGGAHWMDPINLERSGNMIHDKELPKKPEPSPSQEIVKKAKQAASAQEQKLVEPPPLTLEGWYLRLRQFYPHAVVLTYPMSYDSRAPAMLPSDMHAWVAEIFDHPQGLMITKGHGYASPEKAAEGVNETGLSQWPWQQAEERAEIAAISRLVPLGLGPPGKE